MQLISRGRENGLSVVDLSRKTGYDPKTCHYLVEKLLELNLMYECFILLDDMINNMYLLSVKLKKAGVGANFCIHKYFFERSETWKTVQAEADEATQAENDQDDEPIDDDNESKHGSVRFDPIDSRHLSSLPLIKSRLVKLLKNSPSNIYKYANLIVAIVSFQSTKDLYGLNIWRSGLLESGED